MKKLISLLSVRSNLRITILAVFFLLLGISSRGYCDTWTQVNQDGFGDINNTDGGSIVFNGYIYLKTENNITGVEIWRSSDGTTWVQINQDGFGDTNNSGEEGGEFIIFQNQLYYLVSNNITGVEVWRTSDGTTWGQINVDGFGDPNNKEFPSPIVFNNDLYVSVANVVTGIEIWRTQDGVNWTQVNVDGFGDPNNNGNDSGGTVFNGYLYMIVNNDITGVEIWKSSDGTNWVQVNQDGFGDPNNTVEDNITFQCYLYVATINSNTGTEVWRTLDGTTWEQVNQDGFGDTNNYAIWNAQIFGSHLYMPTANNATGTEVWRTSDGATWTQVNQDGFGNSNNKEIWDFIIFGDYLYGVTSVGSEVWKTSDGASWTMANSIGFGDINNRSASFTVFGNYLYAITGNYVTGIEIWRTSLPSFTSSNAGTIEWKSPNFGQVPEGEGVKVADVNDDGNSEIIAIGGTGGGSVHVFGHDGTTYQEEWASQVLANALDDLAIGDVDGDGRLEIIVSTLEAGNIYIYVYGFDGNNYQLEWQSNLFPGDGHDGLSIHAVDADGDGLLEIVATSDAGSKGYIWVYDYNGVTYQQTWASGLLDAFAVIEDLIIADIDGDGIREIVSGGSGIHIIGYNGTSYQIEWQSGPLGDYVGFTIGDVNADGALEFVVSLEGGANNIQIYRFDGQTYYMEWQSCEIRPGGEQIGDVDGDGIKEIVVGSWSGEIYIYGYDGTTYQLEWQTATPSPYAEVRKIADFDQDGNLEILVQELTDEDSSDDTYYIDVYGYDGSSYKLQWRDLKINSYFGGLLDPAGDIDNDGIIEEVRFANSESKFYPFSIYVIGTTAPTCSISLTGTAPAYGVDICIANPCTEPESVELKIWAEFQGQKIAIINAGSDGSIVLPAEFSICFTLVPPSLDLPSGLVGGIRLIDPVKGEEFCAHTVTVP